MKYIFIVVFIIVGFCLGRISVEPKVITKIEKDACCETLSKVDFFTLCENILDKQWQKEFNAHNQAYEQGYWKRKNEENPY